MQSKNTVLMTILLAIVATSSYAADDVMKWNKTPEAYYMTAEERTQWSRVASPEDARKFIDEYRRKRGEAFGKEVRTRIDLADTQFKLDKTPGSQTARGRVWMLIGSPNRSRTNRDVSDSRVVDPLSGTSANALENKALLQTEWIYDADRLPAELGRKSLTVKFQTDSRRGLEIIENVGVVEPYLLQAAGHFSQRYVAAAAAQTAQRSAVPSETAVAATAADPLWNATPSLNGALFTGESFLSPREESFYAYSFYVPSGATTFGEWKNVLVVSLVRDSTGKQVVAQRQLSDLSGYDDRGNRYVDRSFALQAGKYEGLFAIYTPDGATLLSSHRASFEVAAKETARASALLLTSRVDILEAQDSLDPFTFVATKYAVRGDRQFRATDKLAFFTIISNPIGSPSPNLMQKMIFKRDGKEFAKTPLEPAQVTQTGPNTFLVGTGFDPETFPAGHYSLELQVRDMNAPDGSELRTKGYLLTTEYDILK